MTTFLKISSALRARIVSHKSDLALGARLLQLNRRGTAANRRNNCLGWVCGIRGSAWWCADRCGFMKTDEWLMGGLGFLSLAGDLYLSKYIYIYSLRYK